MGGASHNDGCLCPECGCWCILTVTPVAQLLLSATLHDRRHRSLALACVSDMPLLYLPAGDSSTQVMYTCPANYPAPSWASACCSASSTAGLASLVRVGTHKYIASLKMLSSITGVIR
jgi:hypothetical protein